MKKQIIFYAAVLASSFLLSGCSEVAGDFTLTQDEEQKVVGYCADVLLKYDKNHQSDVVDTSLARELEARVDVIKELHRQQMEQEGTTESEKSDSGNKSSSGGENSELYAAKGEQNLAAALGQEGFEVTYKNFEVCTGYPHDGSAGDYFTLEATPGKQLMVFHFDITNTTGEDRECNFMTSGVFYRMIVNGSERKNALTTLLLNDMSTLDEVIGAGQSVDGVVVLETDKNYEKIISSLTLLAKYGTEESVIPLMKSDVAVPAPESTGEDVGEEAGEEAGEAETEAEESEGGEAGEGGETEEGENPQEGEEGEGDDGPA